MTHQDHATTAVHVYAATAPELPAPLAAAGSEPGRADGQLRRGAPGETGHEDKQ
jgi:hypothetical protein